MPPLQRMVSRGSCWMRAIVCLRYLYMKLFAVPKAYEPLDPYLDGILRFGGGYSNMLGATGQSDIASFHPEQRNEVFDYVRTYAKAVDAINAASQGTATCVFVPPPQAGLGCKQAPN